MIRSVVQASDPVLRKKSDRVAVFDPAMRKLAGDLVDTMRKHRAMGLSAVQVGEPVRIVAVNPRSGCPFEVLVNPVILKRTSETTYGPEGCLSIGEGVPRYRVRRAKQIVVGFTDRADQYHEIRLGGVAAIVVQHEVDHLDGVLITDHAQAVAA